MSENRFSSIFETFSFQLPDISLDKTLDFTTEELVDVNL